MLKVKKSCEKATLKTHKGRTEEEMEGKGEAKVRKEHRGRY